MVEMGATIAAWSLPHILLQVATPEAQRVEIPLLPLFVTVVAVGVVAAIAISALMRPAARAIVKRRRAPRPTPPKPVVVEPEREPVYDPAPIRIVFPQVPEAYPDVWGVNAAFDIELRVEDKGLLSLATIPGLSVRVADEQIKPAFTKGVARIKRTFRHRGPHEVVAELKVKGERLPRRSARVARIVDYREEMAEVFHKFREEASETITVVPDDATPWEVFDLLTSARPDLPEETIRRIVHGFEEAKYSNHPVTRESYTRMIDALLELDKAEG
jgi:hypothetical protein